MATVGQLVYNLEDYDNSGDIVSSDQYGKSIQSNSILLNNKLNIYSNLFNQDETGPLGPLNQQRLIKLGIQAPPGTWIEIGTASNSSSTAYKIMIGRNGIYEIEDEQIRVRYLRFLEQYEWILNEEETLSKLNRGTAHLEGAKAVFDHNLANISKNQYYEPTENKANFSAYLLYDETAEKKYIFVESDSLNEELGQNVLIYYKNSSYDENYNPQKYWERYDVIFNSYLADYEQAYSIYIQGINGVYKIATELNENGQIVNKQIELKNIIIDYISESDALVDKEGIN